MPRKIFNLSVSNFQLKIKLSKIAGLNFLTQEIPTPSHNFKSINHGLKNEVLMDDPKLFKITTYRFISGFCSRFSLHCLFYGNGNESVPTSN